MAGSSDSGFSIELSDNLTIDLKHDKFLFEMKSDIEGVMWDINFLDAVCHGNKLISGRIAYVNIQIRYLEMIWNR